MCGSVFREILLLHLASFYLIFFPQGFFLACATPQNSSSLSTALQVFGCCPKLQSSAVSFSLRLSVVRVCGSRVPNQPASFGSNQPPVYTCSSHCRQTINIHTLTHRCTKYFSKATLVRGQIQSQQMCVAEEQTHDTYCFIHVRPLKKPGTLRIMSIRFLIFMWYTLALLAAVMKQLAYSHIQCINQKSQ